MRCKPVKEDALSTAQPVTAALDTRGRLLDGMAAAIGERGYRESTIADVVRHARTSRRTFYEHFESRQDCLIALLTQANARMVAQIAAAVDPRTPWPDQVRQAIEAWIASARAEPALTLAWIREVPSLGDASRQLQRDSLETFVVLVHTLTDTPGLRAAGIRPPPRQFAIMLLAGLRELFAITVEDGGDIAGIIEPAVSVTLAMLGPAGQAQAGSRLSSPESMRAVTAGAGAGERRTPTRT
jgi:AcrR family transcriptional regulator